MQQRVWNFLQLKKTDLYFPDEFSHILRLSFIYQHCKVAKCSSVKRQMQRQLIHKTACCYVNVKGTYSYMPLMYSSVHFRCYSLVIISVPVKLYIFVIGLHWQQLCTGLYF